MMHTRINGQAITVRRSGRAYSIDLPSATVGSSSLGRALERAVERVTHPERFGY